VKIDKELLKGSNIPVILQALSEKEMYGYELIKHIEEKTNGIFLFKEGTLYPLLHKLESEEAVVSFWETVDGRKRKYYKLTKSGQKMLAKKKKEWAFFKGIIDTSLGGKTI